MTLEIRPGLRIHTHTIPGSGYIQWWIHDSQRYMFNPSNGTLWPYDPDSTPENVYSMISPSDLAQITMRLLRFAEDRSKSFTRTNGPTPIKRPHDDPSRLIITIRWS